METLDAFLVIYADDDNEWWRLDSGQHQNLFDSLLARAEAAEAEAARLRTAITGMANTYAAGRGRFGGTGIADELQAILIAGDEAVEDEVASLRRENAGHRVTIATLKSDIAALCEQVAELTTCDYCGNPLSRRGMCRYCDNDK